MMTTAAAGKPVTERAAGLVEEFRPRMRGWLHLYAAIVSVVTGATLIAVSSCLRGERAALATSIYAVTATLLFTTSALYHRGNWQPRSRLIMKRLDHCMIFVCIAGTYTPFAILTLPDPYSIAVLAVVWTGALGGTVLKALWPTAPRPLSVPLYMGLGWVAVFIIPQILNRFGVATLVLILVGGACYTAGAVSYGLKKPNPFPKTFGFHEIFHSYTLLASLCFYIAVWLAVFS
jgi:hemolysin III